MDSKKLEKITEKFCDKYCKFADTVSNQDELDGICENCPMNELFELLD